MPLRLSAADVRAIVDDPSNHAGREAVAPIAQIAAARLFGPRWSTLFSIAFGMMLLSTLSAYVLIGPRVVYAMARAGQFPSIAARLTRRAGTPAVATALQTGVALVSALDRLIRESDHLRGRWSFDLLDARGELDLRSALETPRDAPAVPDARISGHAGGFPARDRAAHGRHGSRAPAGFFLCGPEHSGRRSVLLHLAESRVGFLTRCAKPLN